MKITDTEIIEHLESGGKITCNEIRECPVELRQGALFIYDCYCPFGPFVPSFEVIKSNTWRIL